MRNLRTAIEQEFAWTTGAIAGAVDNLTALKDDYRESDLDEVTKRSRIAALEAKIDYLFGLKLDPLAYPWVED